MENIKKTLSLQLLIGSALLFGCVATCLAEVELKCHSNSCSIQITGSISAKDANAVAKIPSQLQARKVVVVSLDSPGGDVDAAMAMGRVFRSMKVMTIVGMDAECSSACVMLLASGVRRLVAKGLPSHDKGRVGIHRLFLISTSDKDYDSIQQKYRQMESKVRTYLKEMNVPEALYDAMMRIPSEKPRYLSASELAEYSLNVDDPVYADLDNSKIAAGYGLPKIEYLRLKSRVERECKTDSRVQWDECVEAIFKGSR